MFIRKTYITQTFIALFFFWHAFFIGVGGISNTLAAPFAKTLREQVYYKIIWYPRLLDQNQQNWGFFSFVPDALVRFTFETWDGTNWKEIYEYKLASPPYFARHNEFNFLSALASDTDKYKAERERYVQDFCKQHGIANQIVFLRKKYTHIPKVTEMDGFTWENWEPTWEKFTLNEVQC